VAENPILLNSQALFVFWFEKIAKADFGKFLNQRSTA
jgi:hypothetical protein